MSPKSPLNKNSLRSSPPLNFRSLHPRRSNSLMYLVVGVSALLLAFSDALGGLTRYLLLSHGSIYLYYVPQFFAATIVIVATGSGLIGRQTAKPLSAIIATAAVCAYSVYAGREISAIMFELYTLVPLMLGVAVIVYGAESLFFKYSIFIWLISVLGVVLDYRLHFPWAGTDFEAFGLHLHTALKLTSFSVVRVAGFTKASYAAGNWIAITAAIFVSRQDSSQGYMKRFYNFLLRAAVWGVSLVAIAITTSKTPLIALATLPLFLIVYDLLKTWGKNSNFIPGLIQATFAFLILLIVAPPLLQANVGNGDISNYSSQSFFRLESLIERFTSQWPGAFNLLDIDGKPFEQLFGRGLGGIGVGQTVSEPNLVNSADNLFVYLYVMLGVFALPVVVLLFTGVRKIYREEPLLSRTLYGVACIVLITGVTTSVIESLPMALLLGMILGKSFRVPPFTSGKQERERLAPVFHMRARVRTGGTPAGPAEAA